MHRFWFRLAQLFSLGHLAYALFADFSTQRHIDSCVERQLGETQAFHREIASTVGFRDVHDTFRFSALIYELHNFVSVTAA